MNCKKIKKKKGASQLIGQDYIDQFGNLINSLVK